MIFNIQFVRTSVYYGASCSSLTQDYQSYSATLLIFFSSPCIYVYLTLPDFDTVRASSIEDSDWHSQKSFPYSHTIHWISDLVFYVLLTTIYLTTLIISRPVLLMILMLMVGPYVDFLLIWLILSLLVSAIWCFYCLFFLFQLSIQRKLSFKKKANCLL